VVIKKATCIVFLLIWIGANAGWASDHPNPGIEIIGQTRSTAVFNSLEGPGSEIKGLAVTYDMSIFEFNFGGKQATFNGSGITSNTSYPLTEGEAFTNNTRIGVLAPVSQELKAGFLIELYSLIGDRTAGRVFGEQLPWGDFAREKGVIEEPHFNLDFYQGFLEGKRQTLEWKAAGGTLAAKSLPLFMSQELNQVKLSSLVYRPPIVNETFLSKDERKFEEARHPLKGFSFMADKQYQEKKHLRLDLFSAATEPVPVADIERDAYGGRLAADILEGNVGFTCVYNEGLRPTTGLKEDQWVWAVDASYKIASWLVPYFTFAQTNYERETIDPDFDGDAIVAGILLQSPQGHDLRAQYQRVEENYDLMAYHKVEHYPGNFHGLNAQGTVVLSKNFKIKGVVYYLEQIDTAVTAADTLFGDSFFVSRPDSEKGTIGVERLGAEWKPAPELSVNGYVEHAKFRKNTRTASTSIDKDVYNFYVDAVVNITKRFYVEGGFRQFFFVGNWEAMPFRSTQWIPEGAIGYKIDKDKQALLVYQHTSFEDNTGVSAGRNDYEGEQVMFVVRAQI
jgi:hypothetical protein